MSHDSSSRTPLPVLRPHGRPFIAAFVCAHLAALGAAYAAAALQAGRHELPADGPAAARAVHHFGRMTLLPLRELQQPQPPGSSRCCRA